MAAARKMWDLVGRRARYGVGKLLAMYRFRRRFRARRVCVVGNAAALDGRRCGAAIDAGDVVVRFNVALVAEREDTVGARTDLRFVGLTLGDRWSAAFAAVPVADALWTFDKNAAYLTARRRQHVAMPTELQRFALPLFLQRHPDVYGEPLPPKPPRSGLVFLLLLLLYGRPREVVVFGFSQDVREAYESVSRRNETRVENRDAYADAHCDPSVEVAILRRLVARGMVTLG